MLKKFNKTYRFALLTAAYASIISMLILGIFLQVISGFNLWHIFVFGISFFVICFALIQYRLERFIYKRIKNMYDDISLLDALLKTKKLKSRP